MNEVNENNGMNGMNGINKSNYSYHNISMMTFYHILAIIFYGITYITWNIM